MYVSGMGLVGARLNPSEPRDSKQWASVPHREGGRPAKPSGGDGTYPPKADLHQRLQAAEHRRQAAEKDRKNGGHCLCSERGEGGAICSYHELRPQLSNQNRHKDWLIGPKCYTSHWSDADKLWRQSIQCRWPLSVELTDFRQPDLSYSCFKQSSKTFLFCQWVVLIPHPLNCTIEILILYVLTSFACSLLPSFLWCVMTKQVT